MGCSSEVQNKIAFQIGVVGRSPEQNRKQNRILKRIVKPYGARERHASIKLSVPYKCAVWALYGVSRDWAVSVQFINACQHIVPEISTQWFPITQQMIRFIKNIALD